MKPPNVCYAIKGNYIDRDTKQNGKGWSSDGMYTLDATDRHGVCYETISFEPGVSKREGGVTDS